MADPAWPEAGVLAVTKLHVPDRASGLVARDALVRLLCHDNHAKLTLVSAPAGAGKTTLLAEWSATPDERRPVAWLSLDADDSDPVRFWGAVIAALRTVHPGFGGETLRALRTVHHRLVDVVVPLLVNEAAALERETVVVLDDLHVVRGPAVHDSLAFLLDHLPRALRVAVATRVDPPLPLPRLRARGELCEVRGSDLRFSDAEAAALLRERFGVRLEPVQLARLQQRTEGWAAGLQLAGLSLRRGVDPDALVDAVAAGGALEYLAGEVLEAQDPPLRRFLLDTSVLERLTAPLCDAVTGRDDAAERLPELERRNLLAVPLDPQRRWWRYHHLFAELLRGELARADAARSGELHRRAMVWHAEHGMTGDAIRHALAAGEHARAAALVAEGWSAVFNRGELATLEAWLDALPPAAVVGDPRLWLARLWTAMDRGRLAEVADLLDEPRPGAAPGVDVWARLLRALRAFKLGDVGGAEDEAARAQELDPDDRFWRTVAALLRGLTGYARGRRSAAAAFEEAGALAREDGNRLAQVYARGYGALIAAEAGLEREAATALAALDDFLVGDPGLGEHFVAHAGALARGVLAERAGRYEAAAGELARAVALVERGAGCAEIAHAKIALGQVQWARGQRDEARRLAREARRALADAPDPGRVGERLHQLERRAIGHAPVTATPSPEPLSDAELAVLRLLPSSLSNREIGQELYVSVNTVKTHVRSIYAKLQAQSRQQAVGRARELRLL